jgi:hypothetical protein
MPRGHPGQVKQTGKKSKDPKKDPKFGNLPGPGPGRFKGVPNKVNRDLKEAYLMAANLAGGKEGLVGYLKKQAELVNPSAFMTGLSKLLPSMLEGNPDAPLIVERVYYTRDGDA